MRAAKVDPNDRYFRYLTRLSAGGRSNMYGAIPYLAAAFGIDRETAFRLVCEWVDRRAALHAEAPREPTPPDPHSAAAAPKPSTSAPVRHTVKRKRAGARRAA
jgi:hypothetical protein